MIFPKKTLGIYVVTLLCLLSTNSTQPCEIKEQKDNKITHIIFDLNGVFFDTSRFGMMQEVGLWNCILYLATFKNPGHIKQIAFKFLDTLSGPQKEAMQDENGPIMADGLPMPELMRRWKSGETTGAEILEQVNNALRPKKYDTHFSSWIEKRLVKNIINAVLNPNILAKHTYPITAGVKILEDCAKNKELTLLILSNYAPDAFKKLSSKKKSAQVFKHFKPSNIVISGNVGYMKPNKHIFDYVIAKYGLDPKTCVFVDDHENNTKAAEKLGFNTILVEKNNFVAVRKQLVKLNVLDK